MTVDRGLHGWLVIDKPLGITSSKVVVRLRHATGAEAGHLRRHARILATGILPIAFGEATKTVAFVSKATKRYSFRVRWGIATASDDSEGEVVAESPERPDDAAITAAVATLHRHGSAASSCLLRDQDRRAARLRAGARRPGAPNG